jgi:outer membrane lipoprotein SlyB
MKHSAIAALALLALAAQAQTVHKIPVTKMETVCTDKLNGVGAAVGAGTGYVAGQAAKKLFDGSSSMWGLVGAAAGGLIGANTAQEKSCNQVEKVIGYKVLTVQPDGTFKETFEEAK